MPASDLPGTYVAHYGFAEETVALTTDRHFIQTVRVTATGKVAVATGTWDFDSQTQRISFSQEFFAVSNAEGTLRADFEHPRLRGTSVLSVLRGSRGVQIGGDPGVPYVKQPIPQGNP